MYSILGEITTLVKFLLSKANSPISVILTPSSVSGIIISLEQNTSLPS